MIARTYGNGAPTWSKSSLVCLTGSPYLCRLTRLVDDFFVGIGDINSAFLPKLVPLTPAAPPPPVTAVETSPEIEAAVADPDAEDEDEDDEDLESDMVESSDSQVPPVDEDTLTDVQKNEILTRNTEALEAQVEERPLAKAQEELQETETAEEDAAAAAAAAQPAAEAVAATNGGVAPPAAEHKPKERHVRKALLKNDDAELTRVKQVCSVDALDVPHG